MLQNKKLNSGTKVPLTKQRNKQPMCSSIHSRCEKSEGLNSPELNPSYME
nr:MAG TPA: hypothetical protein [Caudoviricetes sp.]